MLRWIFGGGVKPEIVALPPDSGSVNDAGAAEADAVFVSKGGDEVAPLPVSSSPLAASTAVVSALLAEKNQAEAEAVVADVVAELVTSAVSTAAAVKEWRDVACQTDPEIVPEPARFHWANFSKVRDWIGAALVSDSDAADDDEPGDEIRYWGHSKD